MARAVLGRRAHVEHDDLVARHPLLQLLCRKLFDAVAVAQVLVGQHRHLGDMADGDVADGRPELSDAVACQPVENASPLAPGAHQARASQHLQMLRGVGDALPNLVRQLVDRAFPLGEHVDDLGSPPAAERLRDRRQRIE